MFFKDVIFQIFPKLSLKKWEMAILKKKIWSNFQLSFSAWLKEIDYLFFIYQAVLKVFWILVILYFKIMGYDSFHLAYNRYRNKV